MICNGVFRFCNGVKVGTHWKWNRGNGFTVGELDHENRNIGKSEYCTCSSGQRDGTGTP
jgi:hypothetical protein